MIPNYLMNDCEPNPDFALEADLDQEPDKLEGDNSGEYDDDHE